MEEKDLIISAPPHIKAPEDTAQIMYWVIAALMPATLASVYFFKLSALVVVVVTVLAAVATEYIFEKIQKLPVTISDGSAALTGLLLALTLPPRVPWWIALIGGVVAILLGKQLFGGLGWNVFNPALVARAVLVLSWTKHLTKDWYAPLVRIDAKTTATPLYAMKPTVALHNPMKLIWNSQLPSSLINKSSVYLNYLWGNKSGCIGEVSAALLIVGAIILLWKNIIDWRIPFMYLGTVAVLTLLLKGDPVFYLLAGGLMLGAFYMATDYVTSSITPLGKLIFGFGCGAVTVLLRFYSGLPEAVMFAILFMNMCAPLIDRYTIPTTFGWGKKNG